MKAFTGMSLQPRASTFATLVLAILGTLAASMGAADPVNLTSIRFETASVGKEAFVLRGPDARHQLVVTGGYGTGQLHDLTRDVDYQSSDGVVQIDPTGLLHPLHNGQTTITAVGPDGLRAATTIVVERVGDAPAVNFPNQVVPVFTKLGCNNGSCHGKSGGQNGFALSLLGFEPQEDYEHLVREGRGRRVFPAAAENSLVLLKATNTVPHGGGMRMHADSHDYRVLRRWIEQSMPYGDSDDPSMVRIQVIPAHRIMAPGGVQQLCVLAHYSDGSIEDVTHTAQFDSNEKEMAQVDESGRVHVSRQAGDAAIMVRYQEQSSVYRATIPLGAAVEALPEPANFIDEHVFRKLKLLGMPPSPPGDDPTFIRRVTLDIAGRLPTPEETTRFLEITDPGKRDDLIDRLVASADYADFFANKWSAILKNKGPAKGPRDRGTFVFHEWIRQCFHQNVPYDQFVRAIIAASGDLDQHPPVVWYRQVSGAKQRMEDAAQLFLGVRMQCAQCHHHPFETWSQDDYYGLTAFFTQVKTKSSPNHGVPRLYHVRGDAGALNPKTEQTLRPTFPESEPLALAPEDDPRHALVDWMAHQDNPFFARSLVNRYWKHFFNRGLVNPEDDMRVTNPASNPELLDALADFFLDSGFDLKALIRVICQSRTYQLASAPNEHNSGDKQNFSRYYPRRLNAEVLLDAMDTLTGGTTKFKWLPAKTRAVQIPDTSLKSYFLTLFGRPQGTSACECERMADANLAQSLYLLNSNEIRGKLTRGRAQALGEDTQRSNEEKVRHLYLLAYSRAPDESEIGTAMVHIEKTEPYKRHEAYEDIVWALINTKEFMFNH